MTIHSIYTVSSHCFGVDERIMSRVGRLRNVPIYMTFPASIGIVRSGKGGPEDDARTVWKRRDLT